MFRRRAVYLVGALAAWAYPAVSLAQSALTNRIVPCDGVNCTVCDIAIVAQNVLNTAIFVLVALSAVLFAYAGWKMLTAQGNTESYSQGKSIFGNVVLGLVIILAGWIVIDTLMKTMTNSSFGPWNKIC